MSLRREQHASLCSFPYELAGNLPSRSDRDAPTRSGHASGYPIVMCGSPLGNLPMCAFWGEGRGVARRLPRRVPRGGGRAALPHRTRRVLGRVLRILYAQCRAVRG
jgi:hypothetical protein